MQHQIQNRISQMYKYVDFIYLSFQNDESHLIIRSFRHVAKFGIKQRKNNWMRHLKLQVSEGYVFLYGFCTRTRRQPLQMRMVHGKRIFQGSNGQQIKVAHTCHKV